jgi:hypothetical protein
VRSLTGSILASSDLLVEEEIGTLCCATTIWSTHLANASTEVRINSL